jgi:uncharacterized protein YjiS (DUF1127 family)
MPTTVLQISRADNQALGLVRAMGRSTISNLSIRWLLQLQIWIERSRQRIALRELAETDEHLLRDIGKTKAEAAREAASRSGSRDPLGSVTADARGAMRTVESNS